MIVLVAANHKHAYYWCRHIADPPVNPRSRDILILTGVHSVHRALGIRLDEDDSVIVYTWPQRTEDAQAVSEMVARLEAWRA